ncbi:MAG: peroxiredoxin [Candidatus Micrarchaeota archaeon]|nr:peroxiredoxin [Candidatus Micrarchaeota archaeon]
MKETKLKEGSKAPLFALFDSDGKIFDLKDYSNKTVVIYFYPKDDTPGCTTQACTFSSLIDKFKEKDVTLVGISSDDSLSHKKFKAKYNILFPLLVDKDWFVAKLYGAYSNNKVIRSTFIIKNLKIKKAFYDVDPSTNPKEVLNYI